MHLYEQGLFRFLILKMWTEDTDSCYNRNKSKIGIIHDVAFDQEHALACAGTADTEDVVIPHSLPCIHGKAQAL